MYFEEFELGFKTQIEPATITQKDMVGFAKKYDNIPLHTDEEYAKSTFFGQLIAHGVMSFMAVWAKYLEKDLAGAELSSVHIGIICPKTMILVYNCVKNTSNPSGYFVFSPCSTPKLVVFLGAMQF